MYKIIGADQKEYGPISADLLRQWMAQGRVNGQTQVLAEGGTAWQAAGEIPELAVALRSVPARSLPTTPGIVVGKGGSPLPPDVRTRDYQLNLDGCLGRAWALVTGPRIRLTLGGVGLGLLILAGLTGLSRLPVVGWVFSLVSLVVGGPLVGGVCLFLLRCLRGQSAKASDIFDGLRHRFGQLFLGQIVMALLLLAAVLPGLALAMIGWSPRFGGREFQGVGVAMVAVGGVMMLAPALYLSVSWLFTLPLIMDKRLDFRPAMQLSRAVVGKHWWTILLVKIIAGVLISFGVVLCGLGVFFTVPLAFAFALAGYEKMFSQPTAPRPPTTF